MPIKIKLLALMLLAACFVYGKVDSTVANDDNALGHNAASADSEEVISGDKDGETEIDRPKRLYAEKIRESLDKIKLSLEKTIADKLDSPILGSIRNSSLLKGKSKLPSLLDTYKTTFESRGVSLAPPPCPHQTLPTQEQIPVSVGNVATVSTGPFPIGPLSIAPLSSSSQPIGESSLGDAHKPVVLPDYLMDKDVAKKKKKLTNPNRISMQQLKETADLRKQINYAVKHGIYVHSASEVQNMNQKSAEVVPESNVPPQYYPAEYYEPTTPAPPPPPQFYPPAFPSFDNFYSSFWQGLFGAPRKITKEQTLGSARSDFSYVPEEKPSVSADEQLVNHLPNENEPSDDEMDHGADTNEKTIEKMMAQAAEQMMIQGIVSNTVESYANSEEAPFIEANRVREELNITSVTEDMRFNIGENVIGWRTLQRNKRESHALIGVTNTSVLLVLETNGTYKLQVEKHLLSSPTFFITFTYWNETQQSIDGIVIVSIQHEIVFLRVNEAMDKMEVIWIWPTNNIARYLHHLVLDNVDTLLIITDLHGGSAASLYRFDMNEEVFFLRQSLSLKSRAKNMALIQNGFDTFMCFPQKSHAVIYKYHKDHFRYYTQIESHNANILSAFEMGGYSYLTIGGSKAKILRYHRGTFQDQTILSKSWGNVEFFMPVPARTYRDDLILFVQHRMDYGSHTNSFLEALIWNGQAFHPALQVPCYIDEHASDLGLGCMLDEYRDLGIIGATMFQRNRSISIIVPRHEAPSGLFDLEIDLLPAASTLNEHLLELLSEVIIMLDIRDQVLVEARELTESFPKGPMDEVTIRNQDLDVIYTQQLDLGTLIPTQGVFLGDDLITKEDVDAFLKVLNETETNLQLLEQLKRNKREDKNVIEHLHLKSVNVSELNVRYINDIPAEELVFVTDGNLKLDGTVILNQPIEPEFVERTYDGIDQLLGQEQPEMTVITGDLHFEEINGIKWKDFINQIVLKHLPNSIDDLEITGSVEAGTVNVENLNDIPFPSGFISTKTTDEIIVTSQKVFKNVLVTNATECFGNFNGVQLSQVISLNSSQYIPGTTTFRHLEVTETLEMAPNATISGRRLDEFLSNPTLNETRQIRSTVYFDTLEIEGPLYVQNTMDSVFVDDVLADVVYKHETAPQINSFKRFDTVQAPNIQLTANLINDIPFSSFVTNDTEQTFDVSELHGNFYFQKLKLDGLFNFINVTELDLNSLKLFGEQYTDAEFEFADGDYVKIDANQLEVLETVNGIDVHDFISIDEDFELTGNVHDVSSLKVDELILDGEIKGSPDSLVNGFRLQNLVDTHLSKNNPQIITGSAYIPIAVLRNGINTKFLNGFDFKDIVNILKNLKTNEQMLNESTVVVDQMIVNGSVWFADINGFDLEHIKSNAIRLDQTNDLHFPITFLDSIYVNGNINVEQLNGENFNEFSNDVVLKSADVTRVYGTTVFKEDVTILNNAEVTTINEIQVDRILTKNYNRVIFNPIRIVGDVMIPNLIVKGHLNGVSAEDLNSYRSKGGRFVLKKDVFFNETTGIKYLKIHGGYDNIGNVNEHLKNIIRTDRPAVVAGRKTFTDTIHFEKAIDMIEYNGVNVPTFLANVVLIDQYDPVDIYSDIVFAAPVVIPRMKITGNLVAETINRCSVADWVQNTIRTDQPFDFDGVITFPDGTIEASNINTEFLNENPMDEVITLYTEQTFDKPVHLNYVYSSVPITADGLVSGYNLPKERENTLMIYGTQSIDIPTVFQSVRVLNNLVTDGLVNGRDLRLAASLQQGNIVIDSPLSFGTVSVNQLYTSDLISGINFNKWFENALVQYKTTPQVVTAPWTIKNAIVGTMNVAQGINDMDVNQYLQTLDQLHRKYQTEYTQKCQVAQKLIQNTKKNVIFLSHFVNAFTIDTQSPINSVYLFNIFEQNYFVINSGCQTLIYAWNMSSNNYDQVGTAITGDVVEWIHVLDHENQLFLIANNDGSIDSNCLISGAFVWRFNPNDNSLSQEVQFGRIGEFRSMQMKPNSHALFYVIRHSDSHVIEYNLRGAIVTEWLLDNNAAPPMTSSVRFVPGDAQLGLALSDGNQLSVLTACNCTRRTKRCGLLTEITGLNLTGVSEHRQQFERQWKQLFIDYWSDKAADKFKEEQKFKGDKVEQTFNAKISQATIDSIKEKQAHKDITTKISAEETENQKPVASTQEKDIDSNSDSVDHILGMISEVENITNAANKAQDPNVGDKFGDIMFKLTPFADKIMDKVMDKLRRKQYKYDEYLLGSAQEGKEQEGDDDDDSVIRSKVSGLFRKIGKSLFKVYAYGKDRFQSAKHLAKDVKFLYTTYSRNFMEDNQNDNITYGPPDVYGVEDKANEPAADIHPDEVNVKNLDQNKKKLHDQIHSVELQREMEIISKVIPNTKEFAQAFAVEMIKTLINNNTENGQNATFWPVIKNAVKGAFQLHLNSSHGHESKDEKAANLLIFKGLMNKLNETIEYEQNKSNMGSEVMVGSILDDSMSSLVSFDQMIGSRFDALYDKFTPLINELSDRIVTNLRKQSIAKQSEGKHAKGNVKVMNAKKAKKKSEEKIEYIAEQNTTEGVKASQANIDSIKEKQAANDTATKLCAEEIEAQEPLTTTHEIDDDSKLDHILGIISEAENITNAANEAQDPNVGDKFGDIMFKLTPFADKIMDKVLDKIRWKQYNYDEYLLGSVQGGKKEDANDSATSSKVSGFFRKIGKSLFKVYAYGKKRFQTEKTPAKDVKFLYNTYFDNFIEDNQNDNITYGPPDVYGLADKANEPAVNVKNFDQNKKKLHDQIHSVELQREMEIISKVIPNTKEFSQAFAVEMIKTLVNNNTENSQNATFWPVIRNAVKAAFELHLNSSHGHESKDEKAANLLIFKGLMNKLNDTIEYEQNKSNMGSEVMVGSILDDSMSSLVSFDQMIGSRFDALYDKFTPLINELSDRIVTNLRKQSIAKQSEGKHAKENVIVMNATKTEEKSEEKIEDIAEENTTEGVKASQANIDSIKEKQAVTKLSAEEMEAQEPLTTTHEIDDDSKLDHILGIISEAENITNAANEAQDPNVGDKFGDIMFKLTPFADKIMDKVLDKIRWKQYNYDEYLLGSVQGGKKEDADDSATSSKVSGFFRKIGKSLVKVYAYGKDRLRSAKNMANDVKHLYNTYYTRLTEDYHSIELQREMDIISDVMPNSKEFSQAFAVEMIKRLQDNNNATGTSQNTTFWPVIRNAVKAAFELHLNISHENESVDEKAKNQLIFNKFMSKLNETIEHEQNKSNVSSEVMVGSVLGESMPSDSKDQPNDSHFDALFNKFTPLIDELSNRIVTKLQKQSIVKQSNGEQPKENIEELNEEKTEKTPNEIIQENITEGVEASQASIDSIRENQGGNDIPTEMGEEEMESKEPFTSTHEIDDDSSIDSVDHILVMISEAENITNAANCNEAEDPNVGDKFGDIMFKLTPFADKIMDKVLDKIRWKQYNYDEYLLGSVQGGKKEDADDSATSSKVSGFFRKIGKSLFKVYAYGKKRFQTAKTLAKDVKFLYNTYFDNYIEDNQNDNITYGPPDVYGLADKANEPSAEIYPDKINVKIFDQNKKKLHDQIHSVELQREMEIISDVMPNTKEFAQAFAVEMIKMLAHNNNTENDQNATFWPVIRNAVKAAFELHLNSSHGHESEDEKAANLLIFKGLMNKLNETIEHEQNESNMGSEAMVGSVLGESMSSGTKDEMIGSRFDALFDKFTPLIDELSDRIVTKLRKQSIVKQSDGEQVEGKLDAMNEGKTEQLSEEKIEELTEESTTEGVEGKTESPTASQPDQVGTSLQTENTKAESGCTRNITMKEFEQKLNEWKQLHGNADMFPSISSFRSAKDDEAPKPESEKTKQFETTVVSIPNHSLPSHHNGEIIAIRFGPSAQLLIAVSSITEHTIKGDHDRIQIFEDVVNGRLFQTISCYKPRSLLTFNINMETILAFIQDESEIKTYIFRGAHGFVEFTSFTMPSPIRQMIHNEIVTHPTQFVCPEHFLILVMENKVEFMRAVTIGDCKINEKLNC
ncbi:uncharacterized protein LOC129573788 isoform X1 [Sitodiplosis mosellana]|uniref:uncharacterized protein LOC129573788 isoform X1 n=1 Tax=Sitodiplosis mosellana TaxID=263140 RepID=UPI002443A7FF|nr:uncharacterized protein LOC129573788 isoform X1 [Sitodiplosis mosellana]